MLQIVAVEHKIELPEIQNIGFAGRATFLDADILVIDPSRLSRYWGDAVTWDDGLKRLYSKRGSDKLRQLFAARKREIETLLENGKVVFALMAPLESVLAEIRNRSEYEPITNYDWLPSGVKKYFTQLISQGGGSAITLRTPSHPIAPYYKAFRDELHYDAYLGTTEEDPSSFFLVNRSGNPVGCSLEVGQGLIVFVPPPPTKVDAHKLVGVLVQCARPIVTRDFRTPEPEWTKDYNVPGEAEISGKIERLQRDIEELTAGRDQLELERQSLSDFRALLYEQGKPLEEAVMRALRLMGFHAERFQKEDMEHDIVLECPEGRALAEVEGKDNDAIRVGKLDQLTRVVDEDFCEHEVYSEGVLIGNPYRFTYPDERNDAFTKKVRIAAERKGFGLLTTVELFRATVRILASPDDEDFKAACRKAILEAKGKEITFAAD